MIEQSSSGMDNASSSPSPWSGDVPIPAAPVEFSWASPGESEPGLSTPPTGSKLDGPPNPGDVSVASTREQADLRRRQRGLVGAGIGLVMLLAVGWLVFGRGDGGADPDVASGDSTPAETDSGDSLPTVDPMVTETVATTDGSSTGTSGTAPAAESEWRQDTVELPQLLRDTAVPFDLVAVTSDGTYLEIQVPSGRVDLLDISRTGDGRVVAGRTNTLYTNFNSVQNATLLRAGQPPIPVGVSGNIDASQLTAAADGFAGFSYSNNGDMSLISITADGSVVTTDAGDVESNVWLRRYAADGSAVISEAGGVYLERSPGAFERLSTGQMMFASPNHVLVRDCDEAMACGYATVNLATGERTDASLGEEPNSLGNYDYNSASISPDGRWLRYVFYGQNAPQEVLVDLATGTRTELDNGAFGGFGAFGNVWAADGSGFLQSTQGGGFAFYELATGEELQFGEQFGRIDSFDIRTVDGRAVESTSAATPTGVSLIALTEAGDVAQIDVDSGAVITTDGPDREHSAGATVVTDSVGAVIVFSDTSPPLRFRAAENDVLPLEVESLGSPLWPGPVDGSVWVRGATDGSIALVLKDPLGGDLGERILLDDAILNGVVGSDGRGGLVVESELGGVFAVGAGNVAERITSGELLAINATVAYVRECDESLQCGVFFVDRTSGARTLVDSDAFDRAGNITGRAVPSGQNVSPDGAVAFVRDPNDPTRCMVIDTAADSGRWTGVPCADVGSPIIWTADSSAAVWLDKGQITVFDRAARSVRLVNTVKLVAIGARPVFTTNDVAGSVDAVPVGDIVEPAPPTTVPTE